MKRLSRRLTALAVICTLTLALPASAALFGGAQEVPSVAAFSKNGPATGVISFSPDDFRVSGDGNLSSIVLTSLPDPSAGMLTIAGQAIPEGSEVAMSAVSGLRFTPLSAPMLSSTSFTFAPVFAGGQVGEDVTVGLYLLASANSAPVAEALELTTYKNVEATGTLPPWTRRGTC